MPRKRNAEIDPFDLVMKDLLRVRQRVKDAVNSGSLSRPECEQLQQLSACVVEAAKAPPKSNSNAIQPAKTGV